MSKRLSSEEVLARLYSLANPANVTGMARYGINTHNTLGISIYTLRPLAKEIGRDHTLSLELWDSGIHEVRILADTEPPGMHAVTPELEDVYFAQLLAHGLAINADA